MLLFLGDVFLPRVFKSRLALLPKEEIIFNLESPITSAQQGHPAKVNLKADRSHIYATFGRLPLAVNLANNHIMDYRAQGLDDTLAVLDYMGVRYFGVGTVANNFRNPLLVTSGDQMVAIMGYVCPSVFPVFASADIPGVSPNNLETIRRDIETARQQNAAKVIVVMHWGLEDVFLPRPQDITLAHHIIDAGADLIIGHHAHCIQPFEVYNGKYIFYGLGNCIMPDLHMPSYFTSEGKATRIYVKRQKVWHKNSLGVRYDPHSGEVVRIGLHFDGECLQPHDIASERYRLDLGDPAEYVRRFRREYFVSGLRKMVTNFLQEPKLPRPRHFVIVYQQARKAFLAERHRHDYR